MKKIGLSVVLLFFSIYLIAQDLQTNGMHTITRNGYSVNWSNSHLELRTDDNTTPWMTFHRAGYTWKAFGFDGADFIDNSLNKFLLSNNFNNYTPTLTGAGASGNWNINAASATLWGGIAADFSSGGTALGSLAGYDYTSQKIRPFIGADIRNWLGIPPNGETLQSVIGRGNTSYEKIILTKDADQIRLKSNLDQYSDIVCGSTAFVITYGTVGNYGLYLRHADGNVGIGTASPAYKLSVEGTIGTRKIKVTQETWADYIFDSSYQLAPLSHVEKFIKENKHLPEVPSAAEIKKYGLDLGDNQVALLKKIEELTLYIISQNKQLEEQKQINSTLESRLAEIEKRLPAQVK